MQTKHTEIWFSSQLKVVGRAMAPKDVQVLFPGTCEYAALHGK